MGGLCSRRSTEDNLESGGFPHVNGINYGSGVVYQSRELPAQQVNVNNDESNVTLSDGDGTYSNNNNNNNKRTLREPFTFPEMTAAAYQLDDNDGIPRLSRALSNKSRSTKSNLAAVTKVSEVSSLLGKAGTAGLGKAVEVLDTLGSSMTSLHVSSGFVSGASTKGNKITILSFEVANTIVKGANLMQSLSKDNIKHLKEVVLPSEGVQRLISKDMDELLRIAAADKREELKIFSGEVVRFGNRCKDPQWHNLDRYFEKLGLELVPQKQLKEEAETVMEHLKILVQYTAELYHEMHALDRVEQDFRRKQLEEENPNIPPRGDSLAILRAELKSQKKHVRSLQKKSLWSKILEEVMEQLVDIVHFLHMEIHNAFGLADTQTPVKGNRPKLGAAGLALHYANIVTQIDTLVTRSGSVPPSTRDSLYQGLPPNIKSAMRSKIQLFQPKEELSIPEIKAEMEKTLRWLVPIATNTTKAHHGFGWVGEWANTGSEANCKPSGPVDSLRIETLHHADKEKTEECILELIVWLHHLVCQSKAINGGMRSPVKSPVRSPNQKTINLTTNRFSSPLPALTTEDREMLRDVSKRKLTPGISKSQEFDRSRLGEHHRLTKSNSHSPTHEMKRDPFPIKRPSSVPVINFDIDRIRAMDVIDRVDDIQSV
ncbi:protein PSK SIMULATOR 1 [Rutidosis leptorrhynchoides]|uniref:protein PSK SIMULATOR 1 n=1 Tax=Rutidosis leptorrhynchoides TaxID=125765 RepID=UPI003A9A4F92